MAQRATNRQIGKLVRVRNMLNRIMVSRRFKQWVHSVEYILSISDSANLAEKVILKRRLRNNFVKFLNQIKKVKRAEHI